MKKETNQASEVPAPGFSIQIEAIGSAGGPINVRAVKGGLGDAQGTMLFCGHPVRVTSWNDRVIKGLLPERPEGRTDDVVEITLADGKRLLTWLWAGKVRFEHAPLEG